MKVSSVEELVTLVNRVPDDPLCDMGVGSDSKGSPEIKIETVKGRLFQFPLEGLINDFTYVFCWCLGEALAGEPSDWEKPFLDPDVPQEVADFVGVKRPVKRTPKTASGIVLGEMAYDWSRSSSGFKVSSRCPKCSLRTTRKVSTEWVKLNLAGPSTETRWFHITCKKCGWNWRCGFRLQLNITPI